MPDLDRVFVPEISDLYKNKKKEKKRSSPDLDRIFVPEVTVL